MEFSELEPATAFRIEGNTDTLFTLRFRGNSVVNLDTGIIENIIDTAKVELVDIFK